MLDAVTFGHSLHLEHPEMVEFRGPSVVNITSQETLDHSHFLRIKMRICCQLSQVYLLSIQQSVHLDSNMGGGSYNAKRVETPEP